MSTAYPNCPPAYVSLGFAGNLVIPFPERIPKRTGRLLFEGKAFGGLEALGVPKMLYRNSASYAFERPIPTTLMRFDDGKVGHQHLAQQDFFRQNYPTAYVPEKILFDALDEESKSNNQMDRQGNTLVTIHWRKRHFLLHLAGPVLQQVCVSEFDLKGGLLTHGHSSSSTSGSSLHLPTRVYQLLLMGSRNGYFSEFTPPIIVARGEGTATLMELVLGVDDEAVQIRALHEIDLFSTINHIAGNPYTDLGAAFVSLEGDLLSWTPEERLVHHRTNEPHPRKFQKCEYSSHPCVLWTAEKHSIGLMDIRDRPAGFRGDFYSLDRDRQASYRIHDMKRHPASSYQLVVTSDFAVDIIDSRWPIHSVLGWDSEASSRKDRLDGPLEILNLQATDRRGDVGLVLTASKEQKRTRIHGYCDPITMQEDSWIELKPLLCKDSALTQQRGTQAMSIDVPLEISIPDRTKWTHLHGLSAMELSEHSFIVFQSLSVGDVWSQKVSIGSNTRTVQRSMPCGYTNALDSEENTIKTVPISCGALVDEHDATSLGRHSLVPVGILHSEQQVVSPRKRKPSRNSAKLLGQVWPDASLRLNPSSSLKDLHKHIESLVGEAIGMADLVNFIIEKCPGFSMMNTQAIGAKLPSRIHITPHVSSASLIKSSPSCNCQTTLASVLPCDALDCPVSVHIVVFRDEVMSEEAIQALAMEIPVTSPYHAVVQDLLSCYGET